jgi:hypothetical protein
MVCDWGVKNRLWIKNFRPVDGHSQVGWFTTINCVDRRCRHSGCYCMSWNFEQSKVYGVLDDMVRSCRFQLGTCPNRLPVKGVWILGFGCWVPYLFSSQFSCHSSPTARFRMKTHDVCRGITVWSVSGRCCRRSVVLQSFAHRSNSTRQRNIHTEHTTRFSFCQLFGYVIVYTV